MPGAWEANSTVGSGEGRAAIHGSGVETGLLDSMVGRLLAQPAHCVEPSPGPSGPVRRFSPCGSRVRPWWDKLSIRFALSHVTSAGQRWDTGAWRAGAERLQWR